MFAESNLLKLPKYNHRIALDLRNMLAGDRRSRSTADTQMGNSKKTEGGLRTSFSWNTHVVSVRHHQQSTFPSSSSQTLMRMSIE